MPIGRSIKVSDHTFIFASRQSWPVINALVKTSFFASPAVVQRRLTGRLRRQCLKNGRRSMIERQMLSWLQCDLNAKGTHMVSLYCAICRKYEANMRSLKNFRRNWIVGSTNQRTSNLIDHVTSEVHKASKSKLKVERSRARGESAATSTTIGYILSSLDDETREKMVKKFDVCFMMAKESLSFTKYPALLELKSCHGIDLVI